MAKAPRKEIVHIAQPGDQITTSDTPKKKESTGEKVKVEGKAGVKKPKEGTKGGASKG